MRRRKPPRPARARKAAAAKREATVARLGRELNEALAQQKATSEVLHAISSSSGDLKPVFATILANAVRVCDADNGIINRWDGEALHLVASHNLPAEFVALRERAPYRPKEHSASGRMLAARSVIHIPDLSADQSYIERNPPTVVVVERAGVRTTLAVPMFKDRELVGSLTVGRAAVRPFTDKQIEVATSFADQAVIAVENARLLHELQEALEQQTAGAAVRCRSRRRASPAGRELSRHRDLWRTAQSPGSCRQRSIRPGPGQRHRAHRVRAQTDPRRRRSGRSGIWAAGRKKEIGYRTVLGVPLLREGSPIGVIVLMRLSVRPFTDEQIELARHFAAQAIIAIENTRLFGELRQRTDELGRSVAELQRERNNKLMSLEAMAAAISHEVRQRAVRQGRSGP
jgi:GAF domain-containing protein